MSYKEEKKMVCILIIVAILVIAMCVASSKAIEYNQIHTKIVDQFVFDNGIKITIDWNTWVYDDNDEKLYYGCYNSGTNVVFMYLTDNDWYDYLYARAENFYDYYSQTKEWRW